MSGTRKRVRSPREDSKVPTKSVASPDAKTITNPDNRGSSDDSDGNNDSGDDDDDDGETDVSSQPVSYPSLLHSCAIPMLFLR